MSLFWTFRKTLLSPDSVVHIHQSIVVAVICTTAELLYLFASILTVEAAGITSFGETPPSSVPRNNYIY